LQAEDAERRGNARSALFKREREGERERETVNYK